MLISDAATRDDGRDAFVRYTNRYTQPNVARHRDKESGHNQKRACIGMQSSQVLECQVYHSLHMHCDKRISRCVRL